MLMVIGMQSKAVAKVNVSEKETMLMTRITEYVFVLNTAIKPNERFPSAIATLIIAGNGDLAATPLRSPIPSVPLYNEGCFVFDILFVDFQQVLVLCPISISKDVNIIYSAKHAEGFYFFQRC
jgi:hypothetical protein